MAARAAREAKRKRGGGEEGERESILLLLGYMHPEFDTSSLLPAPSKHAKVRNAVAKFVLASIRPLCCWQDQGMTEHAVSEEAREEVRRALHELRKGNIKPFSEAVTSGRVHIDSPIDPVHLDTALHVAATNNK